MSSRKRRTGSSHHPVSKGQFAKLLISRLRSAGLPADFRYDPDRFMLSRERDVLNLTNLYHDFCAVDQTLREAMLVRIVRVLVVSSKGSPIPTDFGDASPDLLPEVRSRSSFELQRLRWRKEDEGEGRDIPFSVIGSHYAIGLSYDLPDAMVSVYSSTLSGWGVSFADALDVALSNLREVSRDAFGEPNSGLWLSPWEDNRDSSRLLLPELIGSHPSPGIPSCCSRTGTCS